MPTTCLRNAQRPRGHRRRSASLPLARICGSKRGPRDRVKAPPSGGIGQPWPSLPSACSTREDAAASKRRSELKQKSSTTSGRLVDRTKGRRLGGGAPWLAQDASLSSFGEERRSDLPVICRRPPVVSSAQFGDHRQSRPRGRPDCRNRGKSLVGDSAAGRLQRRQSDSTAERRREDKSSPGVEIWVAGRG